MDLVLCTSGVAPEMLQSKPLSCNTGAHSHWAVMLESCKSKLDFLVLLLVKSMMRETGIGSKVF